MNIYCMRLSTSRHIHDQSAQNDGLQKKTSKDYFRFLLHLLYHDHNGLVYDYNYNDVMLI